MPNNRPVPPTATANGHVKSIGKCTHLRSMAVYSHYRDKNAGTVGRGVTWQRGPSRVRHRSPWRTWWAHGMGWEHRGARIYRVWDRGWPFSWLVRKTYLRGHLGPYKPWEVCAAAVPCQICREGDGVIGQAVKALRLCVILTATHSHAVH